MKNESGFICIVGPFETKLTCVTLKNYVVGTRSYVVGMR